MNRLLLIVCLITGFAFNAAAQGPDTTGLRSANEIRNHKLDSLSSKPFVPRVTRPKVYRPDSTHSPSLAVKRSALVPGWGQVYNRRWWLVPLIYGGLGALGYQLIDNHKLYKQYLQLAVYKRDGITVQQAIAGNMKYAAEYEKLSPSVGYQALVDAKDNYNRNFQICILSIAVVWGVQVVQAYIDAKFMHSYTMDNNLSFKISPAIMGNPVYASDYSSTFTPGLKLSINF